MTPDPTFRFATPADVPAIVALVNGAYRGEGSRAGWTTEADLLDGQRTDPEAVLALIGTPDTRVVLGERGSELVASCVIEGHVDVAHIGMIAVRPTLQAAGLGRALLAEAERVGRALGASFGEMTVISVRGPLIAWYERRGWARTGASAPFPYGQPRFGLPRRDDLRFVVLRKALTP